MIRKSIMRVKVRHEIGNQYIKTHSEEDSEDKVYLYSSLDFEKVLNSEEMVLEDHPFFLLSYNQKLVTVDINRILLDYERTKVYWLNFVNRSRDYLQYNDMIKRSLLVLKLLSIRVQGRCWRQPRSLPESIGETRNWDYRFCWLRMPPCRSTHCSL